MDDEKCYLLNAGPCTGTEITKDRVDNFTWTQRDADSGLGTVFQSYLKQQTVPFLVQGDEQWRCRCFRFKSVDSLCSVELENVRVRRRPRITSEKENQVIL